MKIKTLNGEVNLEETFSDDWKTKKRTIWVRWADIKPILEELQGELARYQAEIENEQVKCSDYPWIDD